MPAVGFEPEFNAYSLETTTKYTFSDGRALNCVEGHFPWRSLPHTPKSSWIDYGDDRSVALRAWSDSLRGGDYDPRRTAATARS